MPSERIEPLRSAAAGTRWAGAVSIGLILALLACFTADARADGMLRIHPQNRRYFTDGSGRAIFLSGHQWFNDVQQTAWDHAVDVDWEKYLDYVAERRMNYYRNWIIWSTGKTRDDVPSPLMPFARTGPGLALDGKPKFDLTRFDDEFFQKLAAQTAAAEKRKIYVSIMLFEVYGFLGNAAEGDNFWTGNLFHGPNNVNGIDVDVDRNGQGMEFFYDDLPAVRDTQRRYLRKMVETLNPYDNVFYEIANELHAPDWQMDVLQSIRQQEAGLPKRHLVYLSPGGRNRAGKWNVLPKKYYLDSSADVIAVTRSWDKNYYGEPPVEAAGKPVFMDMDHVAATLNDGDNDWNNNPLAPWKLFTRGYHVCIYDHDYWKPGTRRDAWEATRRACGAAVQLSGRVTLAAMEPHSELSSTGYCLAEPGREYVIVQPARGKVAVTGLQPGATYDVEWLPLASIEPISRGTTTAGAERAELEAPPPPSVLYLKRQK